MSAYLVEIPQGLGTQRANTAVVSAATEDDAKAIARSRFSGMADEAWASATVTEIVDVASNVDDALLGWDFRVAVSDPAAAPNTPPVADVTFRGTDVADDVDAIAAQLAILLNATDDIAAAAYDAPSQTLTVAAGISDALGDHKVQVYVIPPAILDPQGVRENQDTVSIDGYVSSITDEGISSADLTVVFQADDYVQPTLYRMLDAAVVV